MASLGQELRKAREERGISLHEIADATNIGVRFLQAIENDTYDILPGGVFNRAFVKKFAKVVNYDEAQALKLYEELAGDSDDPGAKRSYQPLEDFDARESSGNGLLISLLALIILSAGAYLAYEYFKTPSSPPPPAQEQVSNSEQNLDSKPAPTPADEAPVETGGDLKVQLTATSAQCWLSASLDKGKSEQMLLNPGDVREFTVTDSLVLNIGNMPALNVRINGRLADPAKLAPNLRNVVAENVVISKENYRQFVE
ncbi:MAG: helix-turn-helix domain-containing protein [Blastocatellales bacterium]